MISSLIILGVNVLEDARAWSENYPFVIAELFESVEFILWNKLI